MIDEDLKNIEKLRDSLFKSLKNPDGTWKKEKHSVESKELCQDLQDDINQHCQICKVCNKSMEEGSVNSGAHVLTLEKRQLSAHLNWRRDL